MSKKAQKKAAHIQGSLSAADTKFQSSLDLTNKTPAEIKILVKEGKVCFKCKLRPPNYTNKQDKVCKACFMESVVHRFKQSLRLNLKIWKDDLNLICISGGSSSMALLDLMHEALFG
jgi:cytoplasmic tRNA 2-thiolation protein 2